MNKLTWRNEPPDVPGWWWYTSTMHIAPVVVEAMHRQDRDTMRIEFGGGKGCFANHLRGWWAGPIPEPEEEE